MHDMLHALEKVNVDSNPSDDRIKRNITTEDLEMYFQTPKLQGRKFSGKNVDKFEFKNFFIQLSNCTCSISSKKAKLS